MLALDGVVTSAAEFRRLVERAAAGPALVDLSDLPATQALIEASAAALAGRTVLVGRPGDVACLPPLPADTFLVALTSGSTGLPRPVVRSWASWVDSFPAFTQVTGINAADSVLLTGPLSSTLQLFAALHALWLGATVTDDPARATVAHAVPTTLARLQAAPPPLLRTVVVAGADLPVSLVADSPFDIVEYYGAAELSLVLCRRPPEPFRPFPGVEVRTVDGYLQARSPFLADGPTDDGWRGVGDLAEIGADGTVRVLGRGSAALSVGGHTVLCEDVERQLRTLPGIEEAVVVGLEHAALGQVAGALVVTSRDLAQVRAAARTVLDGPALPRHWRVVAALPLLPGGKVDRAAALRLLADHHNPPDYR